MTQDVTNTLGVTASVSAGFDLLVTTQASFSTSYSFAWGFSKATGTTIDNGTTTTFSQTIGQPLGTTGFLTFTPTYTCWVANIDCGHGVSQQPFTYCQPAMSGKSVQGDFTFVATP
jgi:hypothetical protein